MITELRATWRVYRKPSSNQDGVQHSLPPPPRKNFSRQIFASSSSWNSYVSLLPRPKRTSAYSAFFEILKEAKYCSVEPLFRQNGRWNHVENIQVNSNSCYRMMIKVLLSSSISPTHTFLDELWRIFQTLVCYRDAYITRVGSFASHRFQTIWLIYTDGGFIKDEYYSWVQYKSGPGGRPLM
jgi:hypothetical protein